MRLEKNNFGWTWLLGALLLLGFSSLHAQQPDSVNTIQPNILRQDNTEQLDDAKENILQQQEQQSENPENNIEELEDALAQFAKRPIDLNRATDEELAPLVETGLLNELQLQNLIEYRHLFGDFISIYELQAVPGLTVNDINGMLPYVKVANQLEDYNVSLRRLLTKGETSFIVREQRILESQSGFVKDTVGNSKYLGSPDAVYARIRYQFGTRLSYGVTMQKDAGEQFFKGTQPYGFDFYSAHLFFRTNRLIKQVALGDYQLKAGQGLVLGSGLGGRKSAYVLNVMKSGRNLKPYTGANEYLFFRGAAVTIGTKHFEVTPFASYKHVDATLDSSLVVNEEGDVFATSVGQDGYHRTLSEVAKKGKLQQTNAGGIAQYHANNFEIGVTSIYTHFDAALQPSPQVYNQFDFRGKSLTTSSLFYNYHVGKALLFGEGAMSDNGGKAFLQGLMTSLSQRVDAAVVYRNYARDYQSLFPTAFAESSTPQNERGLYLALSMRPINNWQLDVYSDHYMKPWIAFQKDAPSRGTDYLGRLTWTPNKRTVIYAQYKNETSQENSSIVNHVDYLVPKNQQNLRINFSAKVSPSFTLRSRVENVRYKTSEMPHYRQGYLAYQDIVYSSLRTPINLTFRYEIFNTDDYNARIYTFEDDVLYAYSIPSFYGKGSRYYLVARYTMNRHLDFWFRIARTAYDHQNTIGSGYDVITGSNKTEAKVEARLRF